MTPSDSHGQRRERGPGPHEDDPTGIRDLLASLPDPGPMPDDLVERIGARIAVEQAHREQGTQSGFAARSDTVVDLAAERSHRRPGRTVALLGAAAAGLLVATVAIGEFAGIGPASGPAFDSAAQVPARSGAGADGGGAAEEGQDTSGEQSGDEDRSADAADDLVAGGGQEPDERPGQESSTDGARDRGDEAGPDTLTDGLSADVVVLPELGEVNSGNYRDRILDRMADDGAGDATAGSLTEAGARSCWDTVVPDDRWPTLGAAEAELGGDRVVVLLGMRDVVVGQAMVVPWACTEGDEVDPVTSVTWGG